MPCTCCLQPVARLALGRECESARVPCPFLLDKGPTRPSPPVDTRGVCADSCPPLAPPERAHSGRLPRAGEAVCLPESGGAGGDAGKAPSGAGGWQLLAERRVDCCARPCRCPDTRGRPPGAEAMPRAQQAPLQAQSTPLQARRGGVVEAHAPLRCPPFPAATLRLRRLPATAHGVGVPTQLLYDPQRVGKYLVALTRGLPVRAPCYPSLREPTLGGVPEPPWQCE